MKVLLISTADNGGAGLCAYRIHKSLLSIGIDSRMLVLEKTVDDERVFQTGRLKIWIWKALNKALRICHLELTEYNKLFNLCQKEGGCFTSPHTILRIDKHPLMEWADVVHLHWVNKMIDYASFFENVKKPIVWTLHDENLFYGMAHYENAVKKGNEMELRFQREKHRIISNVGNLGIVFLSKMMYEKYSSNPIIGKAAKTIINNSVNYEIFRQHDKRTMREKYGIRQDAVVFAFVSAGINDPRKGLAKLISALQKLGIQNKLILAIGKNNGESYPLTKAVGMVTDARVLSELYSCADYFVMPSIQEAFAQTPLEAMACGLPAVVYPVSGTEELITEKNGVRCSGFTVEDLKEGIKTAIRTKYDTDDIREDVVRRFSPKMIAKQYVEFYTKLQNRNE